MIPLCILCFRNDTVASTNLPESECKRLSCNNNAQYAVRINYSQKVKKKCFYKKVS